MPSRFRSAHPRPAHCPFPTAADPKRMFSANSDTSATGMRTTATKIREITIEGKTFYEVQWPKSPKGRNRQAFRQKTEAETFLKQKLAEQRNYEIAGSGFNLNQRVEYLECADKLAPFNATLRDANNERTFVCNVHSSVANKGGCKCCPVVSGRETRRRVFGKYKLMIKINNTAEYWLCHE